jgi:hypothetical protein
MASLHGTVSRKSYINAYVLSCRRWAFARLGTVTALILCVTIRNMRDVKVLLCTPKQYDSLSTGRCMRS